MNRRILIVGLASTLLLAGCAPTPGLMEVYSTTGSKSDLMTRQSDLLPSAATGNVDVIVDAGRELQELDGFGVAITHSAAYVLLQQDAETRTRILTELFSPEEGAGFSLVRLPIGTSDYAGVTDGEEKHYTYNDLPQGETDPELAGFSLDRPCHGSLPCQCQEHRRPGTHEEHLP